MRLFSTFLFGNLFSILVNGLPIQYSGSSLLHAPFEDARLLVVDDNTPPFWVPQTVAEYLGATELHFMDITAASNLNSVLAPERIPVPSSLRFQDDVNQYVPQISVDRILSDLSVFSSFTNRYYKSQTGIDASNWLFDTLQSVATSRAEGVQVEQFTHAGWAQPSVIARILPQSSSDASSVVVLSAHLDSTAFGMPDGAAPGADDDGSGAMALVEVFRVFVENGYVPKDLAVEFHWYAAEEVGLLGSQDIAQSYQTRGIKVRGVVQLDMIGYDKGNVVCIITDYTDADLNALLRLIVTQYLSISYIDAKCGYACSDHASWTKAGYPSAHPFEARMQDTNPAMHTPNDQATKLSPEHIHEFAKLGLSYLIELAAL